MCVKGEMDDKKACLERVSVSENQASCDLVGVGTISLVYSRRSGLVSKSALLKSLCNSEKLRIRTDKLSKLIK